MNASIGLMTYDEVSYAGGRGYHKNTNYYLYNPNNPKRWWTMSAAGLSNYGLIDSSAWYVSDDGGFYTHYVSFDCALRPVIILKSTVKISDGNGTVDAPFIVK